MDATETKLDDRPLVFAVPSKGSLESDCLDYLRKRGIKVRRESSRIYQGRLSFEQATGEPGATVFFQRPAEIVQKLHTREIDVGITGFDLAEEFRLGSRSHAKMIAKLGFGKANLVLAVPSCWIDVNSLADLRRLAQGYYRKGDSLKVATKFVHLTREFFAREGFEGVSIQSSEGTTELAPQVGFADIIADLTSTGTTLRENHLKTIAGGTILESEACIYVSPANLLGEKTKLRALRTILELIESHNRASDVMEVRFRVSVKEEEAPRALLSKIEKMCRFIESPSWSNAVEESVIEVSALIDKGRVLKTRNVLAGLGGRSIRFFKVDERFDDESQLVKILDSTLHSRGL
ncbi:MAG: ATP phosphoribosyltransferase [Planctomycetes bacterium]|nr:ATP phosphoribosyltransferase [Planctomycetota bacterium]